MSMCFRTPLIMVIVKSKSITTINMDTNAPINRAIIDKNVDIPPYTEIGFNKEEDTKRGFYVSAGGITVVPKGAIL